MMRYSGDVPITFASKKLEDTSAEKESAKSCMKACKEWLEQGVPVFMFPEGRRSVDQSILEFKKGYVFYLLP